MAGANTEEIEDLAGEDKALSELLHGLKCIDVPKNFETRVNARIAEGEPVKASRWAGFQLPVYAASLMAVLVFAALFVWMGGYFNGAKPVPVVAEGKKTNPAVNPSQAEVPSQQQPAVNSQIAPQDIPSSPEIAGGSLPFNKRNPNAERLTGGGSKDSTQGSADPANPRGFDPNAVRRDDQALPRGTNVPITDFLRMIEVTASFQGDALKVSSVHPGSIAEKTGVKVGDIIDAIGETKITPNTTFGGSIQANSITVIRGGQSIKLKLSI